MSEGPKLSEDVKDTYQKRQDVAQVGQTDYAKNTGMKIHAWQKSCNATHKKYIAPATWGQQTSAH
jgi:hypothetical protein